MRIVQIWEFLKHFFDFANPAINIIDGESLRPYGCPQVNETISIGLIPRPRGSGEGGMLWGHHTEDFELLGDEISVDK